MVAAESESGTNTDAPSVSSSVLGSNSTGDAVRALSSFTTLVDAAELVELYRATLARLRDLILSARLKESAGLDANDGERGETSPTRVVDLSDRVGLGKIG